MILAKISEPYQAILPVFELLTLIETKKLNRGLEEKSLTESYYGPGVTLSVVHMFETLNVRPIRSLSKQLLPLPEEGV